MTQAQPDATAAWHISTYSQNADANCVEAGPLLDRTGRVAIRDSTRRDTGMLTARRSSWRSFATWVSSRA